MSVDDDLLEGLEGREREDRLRLIAHLRELGFTDEEMREAASRRRLGLLPVDRALAGEEPCYSQREIAEKAGLSVDLLRSMWRALGFADTDEDEVTFNDRDLEQAKIVAQFHAAGLDEESLILVSQVMGQGMANLAETLREVVGDALLQPGDTELTAGLRWAEAAQHMVPQLTPVLGYLLSVRLREQLKNALVLATELESGRTEGREIVVCFADVVGFTKMGERVDPLELSQAGRQLTAMATDAARPPVRLVKMIGDAAMLVSEEPEPLVEAALALAEAEPGGAPLRVGIAAGYAMRHLGDWLGSPVNIASRVTGVARPGTVLATREVRKLVEDSFSWSDAGSRRLKGVKDPVRLYRVRPAESGS